MSLHAIQPRYNQRMPKPTTIKGNNRKSGTSATITVATLIAATTVKLSRFF